MKPLSSTDYWKWLNKVKADSLKVQATAPFAEKLASLALASHVLEDTSSPMGFIGLAKLFKKAVADGAIDKYALIGGFAVIYYGAPIYTVDADFAVVFPQTGGLLNPGPLFDYFTRHGARWDAEGYLVYRGMKFQIVPANTGLAAEALDQAADMGVLTVISVEHLIAMKLEAGRAKDRVHINHLLRSGAKYDVARLDGILRRYGLLDKWVQFQARDMDQ